MVRFRQFPPSAELRSFVRTFWVLEQDDRSAAPQRIVPDGCPELILNLGSPFEFLAESGWQKQPRCFLAGQIDGPLLLRTSGSARMLGVGFHPHGAARVFRQPMGELRGRFTSAADLSMPFARGLDRALDSPDPVAAVESALIAWSEPSRSRDLLVEESVRRVVLRKGNVDIGRMAGDLGIGIRQFERRFQDAVGLSPKVFCRIRRFNQIFGLLDQPPGNWADVAAACGFYDQAHLIRECRSFSGTVPPQLLAGDVGLARHFYR